MMDVIAQQVFNGLIAGAIYVLVGLGVTLVFGVLGILNFAHGSIAIFGAYVALWFMDRLGLPFVPAMIAAAIVAGLVGLALERLMFRHTRDAPINGLIVSVGLISVFEAGLLAGFTSTPQAITPQFGGVHAGRADRHGRAAAVRARRHAAAARRGLAGARPHPDRPGHPRDRPAAA